MYRRFWNRRSYVNIGVGFALASFILASMCAASAQESVGPDGPVHTFHVYTNLQQVPTLILTPSHDRMKPVDASRFRLSLDSGPLFTPTHVRVEGDDPISLAILIDETVLNDELLTGMQSAVVDLIVSSLRPHDHVSIYAIDCSLVRAAYDLPAEGEQFQIAMERAMTSWKNRQLTMKGSWQRQTNAVDCKPSMPLWNSLAFVARELSHQQGRRVLLAVTDGKDRGSRTTWRRVQEVTQAESIAVFGVMTPEMMGERTREVYNNTLKAARVFGTPNAEDPFDLICEFSGGVEVSTSRKKLAKTLQRTISMVRERYIVEFPRGDDATAGIHSLDITIANAKAYIRPVGIAVPLADAKVLADPSTLRSNPELAPRMGNRKVLKPSP